MEVHNTKKILRMNIDMGDGRTVIIAPQSGIIQVISKDGARFLTTKDVKAIILVDRIRILFECEEADEQSPEVE